MTKLSILIITLLSVIGCSDKRPKIEEGKREFEELYPNTVLVDAKITGDEVIARWMEFTYLHDGENKKIEIQYLKTESGEYEIRPAPPKHLP